MLRNLFFEQENEVFSLVMFQIVVPSLRMRCTGHVLTMCTLNCLLSLLLIPLLEKSSSYSRMS